MSNDGHDTFTAQAGQTESVLERICAALESLALSARRMSQPDDETAQSVETAAISALLRGVTNVSEIAEEVGCHRTHLYRLPQFQQYLEKIRIMESIGVGNTRPKGEKSKDGSVEAWE